MKKLLFILLFFFNFLYSSDVLEQNIGTQNTQITSEQVKEDKSLHLGAHILTGGCAYLGAATSIVLAMIIGDTIAKNHPTLSYMIGFMAGGWIMYRTPQWTDTYIVKKTGQRTLTQNLVTFLNRIILSWPLGVITGEICNDDLRSDENN